MTYIQGFLAAVPETRKEEFITHAERAWSVFAKHGALSSRECWEEDVPDGEVTSFPMAVKREPGEAVVLSWLEWPDKATADACFAAMESDPDFAAIGEMPFDGKRMMWGGFVPVLSRDARTVAPAAE